MAAIINLPGGCEGTLSVTPLSKDDRNDGWAILRLATGLCLSRSPELLSGLSDVPDNLESMSAMIDGIPISLDCAWGVEGKLSLSR